MSIHAHKPSPFDLISQFTCLRSTFVKGVTTDLKWRKWQLQQLYHLVADNTDELNIALCQDLGLGRHQSDSLADETLAVKKAVYGFYFKLEDWTSCIEVVGHDRDYHPAMGNDAPSATMTTIRNGPAGVVLVISPRLHPIYLALQPLAAAIAAGNAVMVKLSDRAPRCQRLLRKLIGQFLDPSACIVVGETPTDTGKSNVQHLPFDHIFFAGSSAAGHAVATAAQTSSTSTTLLLGKQSVAIITPTADLDQAAKRLVRSKAAGNGQTHVATNHVFVSPPVYEQFLLRLRYWVFQFESGSSGEDRYAVDAESTSRVKALVEDCSGSAVTGGVLEDNKSRLPLIVLRDVKPDDPVLLSEILGPVLPIIELNYQDAVRQISAGAEPARLYVFSSSGDEQEYILQNTKSAEVVMNDCSSTFDMFSSRLGQTPYRTLNGQQCIDAFSRPRATTVVSSWTYRSWSQWPTADPPFRISKRQTRHRAHDRLVAVPRHAGPAQQHILSVFPRTRSVRGKGRMISRVLFDCVLVVLCVLVGGYYCAGRC